MNLRHDIFVVVVSAKTKSFSNLVWNLKLRVHAQCCNKAGFEHEAKQISDHYLSDNICNKMIYCCANPIYPALEFGVRYKRKKKK